MVSSTDLIAAYGALLSTVIAIVAGIKYLYDRRPRLEITIHIPESSEFLIPTLAGIIPEGQSIEEIASNLGKIEVEYPEKILPQKLIDALLTVGKALVNNPREAIIRLYVQNLSKKTMNIVTCKIIMKTVDLGEVALKTMERNKRLPGEDQFIEDIKIGDILDLLKPYNPSEDDNVKLIFQFKDEKQRTYKKQIEFNYEIWQDRYKDYKQEMDTLKRLNVDISKLMDYIIKNKSEFVESSNKKQ